jgi:transcriptional regulator with XRE-family HTH domain
MEARAIMGVEAEPAPDTRHEIARRIRELRRARGLTLKHVSDAAGISLGHLSEVERGQSSVSGEKLARLAEALGESADYLLAGRTTHSAIPEPLALAAEELHLTFAQTRRLFDGKNSLVARRASSPEPDWGKEKWISFYRKVKDIL